MKKIMFTILPLIIFFGNNAFSSEKEPASELENLKKELSTRRRILLKEYKEHEELVKLHKIKKKIRQEMEVELQKHESYRNCKDMAERKAVIKKLSSERPEIKVISNKHKQCVLEINEYLASLDDKYLALLDQLNMLQTEKKEKKVKNK